MANRKRSDPEREKRIAEHLRQLRGILDANPRLAERTGEFLSGRLPAPDLEAEAMNEEQIALRLPSDALERAEALVPTVGKAPQFAAVRISRSTVLRMAILRGLEALESEFPTKRAGR